MFPFEFQKKREVKRKQWDFFELRFVGTVRWSVELRHFPVQELRCLALHFPVS